MVLGHPQHQFRSQPDWISRMRKRGLPRSRTQPLQNQTAKLSYQINSKNTLSYTMQWDKKYQPHVVTAANAAFVNTDSVPIQDNPEWVQSLVLNSAISPRSTLEVDSENSAGSFHAVAWADLLPMMDLTTRLVRGSPPISTIDRSHHKNLDVVFSVNTSRGHFGTHNIRVGYGALYEDAPYTRFAGYHDNINTIWSNNFTVPMFIETMDTPFTQSNDSMQHSAFANDSWTYRRVTVTYGSRLTRSSRPMRAQGKTGKGTYQAKFDVKPFSFHWQNALQPRTSLIIDVFGNGRTAAEIRLWPVCL